MCPSPLTGLAWFQEMTSSGYLSPIATGLSWGVTLVDFWEFPLNKVSTSSQMSLFYRVKSFFKKTIPHSLKYLKTYSPLVVLLEEVDECLGLEALLKEVRY